MKASTIRNARGIAVASAAAIALSGCSFSPYSLPLPGGADVGSHPYEVKVQFRDVLDLVPQSGVRVNDVAVGKVKKIDLKGWTAVVTLQINDDAKLPDNATASIRQTSLLGEKFVSLAAPSTGAVGRLGNGDVIPLSRSGRNPEIEEVLGAASLLFNGGGLEKTRTIVRELNKTLDGNEPEIRELLSSSNVLLGQLDRNKQQLISSLEKVNGLAIAANKQKKAITGALDNLPAALRVLNEQRDDLVKLLQSLDRLGVVGTKVIKESKDDTIADLKSLQPALRELADSGDNLSKSLTTLLTFPFVDESVGGPSVQGTKDFHQGDYFNLSLRVDLSLTQLASILGIDLSPVIDGLGGILGSKTTSESQSATDPLSGLAELVGGLVPKSSSGSADPGALLPGATTTRDPGGQQSPSAPKTTNAPPLPQLCSLLGSCRVAPSGASTASISDVGRILLGPVVAR